MRNKSLFLLVACVCGTIAAIGVSQWMHAQNQGGGGGETVAILVAHVDIDKAEEITAEKVRLEQWPKGKEPAGSTGDLKEVLEKYAKTAFYAGEPVMPVKLTESSHKIIPKGYSVVDLTARDIGIANVIQPGDHVNVIAYLNKSDLIPQSMTKDVLMGVRVYALDGDTERKVGDERPKNVRSIQLLIHKNDAQAWTYANELGKIRLAVGNEDDFTAHTSEDGSNDAGKVFLSWIKEQLARQAEEMRPKLEPEPVAAPIVKVEPPKKKEGFEITKILNGRMVKYWIEPGKLPVIIEDTGPDGTSAGAIDIADEATTTKGGTSTQAPQNGNNVDVNGPDSPVFENKPKDQAPVGY